MRWLALIFCCITPLLQAAGAADSSFPTKDTRALRELQNRAFGAPSLGPSASRPEALLALAELGDSAAHQAGQNFGADDKAALFSLLQRYRDELLALGMDAAEMDAQLRGLEARGQEVERRLNGLYVKDGLKIHGRFSAFLDDLHLIGNAALAAGNTPAIGAVAKPAGLGLRNQIGGVHGELRLEGTRGPASALAQLDILTPWGLEAGSIGFRRVQVELRSPVTLQFGDLDGAISPLTLWRGEPEAWFEPAVLRARRDRAHKDLLMVKDKWRLSGLRASSEVTIVDSLTLNIESITAVVGNPATTLYSLASGASVNLGNRYATYLEAWSVGLGMGSAIQLAYNGSLFWDVSSTNPVLNFSPMQETVQTGKVKIAMGEVEFMGEAGFSAYTAPKLTYAAQVDPLTGTAMISSLTWKKENGYISAFGRVVSAGFHAAGAQGRTVDPGFQYLGPFLNEQSNLNGSGALGLDPPFLGGGNRIKLNHASRLNDRLIPPGTYFVATANTANVWQHLLSYLPGEEIDGNGQATPNRSGFGGELQWAFLSKALKPMASYESFQHLESVFDAANTTLTAFTMTRIRAGLELDLEPWTSWPVRFGAGSTTTNSQNGMQDALGKDYALGTATLDGGVQLGANRPFGLTFGYRQMSAKGKNERLTIAGRDGQLWDILAVGASWTPLPEMVLDLVYSQGHNATVGVAGTELEIDQALIRLTTEF